MDTELENYLVASGLNNQTIINLAENGFTNKVLLANFEPDDIDELHIELLAQKKAPRKLCSAHMMANMIQGGQTLQPPSTTPINHQQNVSSNLATLLGFGDPLYYLLPKQKVKHLDITDYINATGQEIEELHSSNGNTKIVVKARPKKI